MTVLEVGGHGSGSLDVPVGVTHASSAAVMGVSGTRVGTRAGDGECTHREAQKQEQNAGHQSPLFARADLDTVLPQRARWVTFVTNAGSQIWLELSLVCV